MKAQTENPNKKSSLIIFITTVPLIAILGLFYIYLVLWRVPDNRKTAEKIRNETIVKIEKGNAILKDDNAWFSYYKAMKKFDKYRVGNIKELYKNTSFIETSGLTKKNTETIKKYVEDNREALELVGEAYRKKSFQIPRDYKQGANERFLNYMTITFFECLLVLDGDIQAKEGKYREAAELYLQALRLGEGIGHNGVLMMAMVDISTESVALNHITGFINDYDVDAGTCRFLVEEMGRLENEQTSFLDFMDNDAVFAHYTLDNMKSGKMSTPKLMKVMKISGWMIDREEQIYENQYLKDRAAASLEYRQAINALTQDRNKSFPIYTIISKMLYPDYKKAYMYYVVTRIQYSGTMLAVALKLYHGENGKYPLNLSELVPDYLKEIPKDSYSPDGKFVYKRNGENVQLYTIGPDMKDEGGKVGVLHKGPESMGDIMFYDSTGKSQKNKMQ